MNASDIMGTIGGYDASQIPSYISDIARNTAETADAINFTDKDVKYLRDIAERNVITRITTDEVKVDFGGITNNVNSNTDLYGMIDYIAANIQEVIESTAEGVHY